MSNAPREVDPDWKPLPDSRPKPAIALLYVLMSAGVVLLVGGLLSMFAGP